MKKFYIPIIFSALLCFASCTDDEIAGTLSPDMDSEMSNGVDKMPSDSLEIRYMMQTNPGLMLTDRIINRGGSFVLDLSPEDAATLHIPEEVYQLYLKKVSDLNDKSEKVK